MESSRRAETTTETGVNPLTLPNRPKVLAVILIGVIARALQ